MNQKRIVLIVLIVLVLGGAAYYYQFQKQKIQNQQNEIKNSSQYKEIENQKIFPLIQVTLRQGANPEIIKEVIQNTDGELTDEKQITDFGWDYYYVKFKTPRTTNELNNLINELKEKSKNIPDIISIWFSENEGIYQRIFEKELEAIYGKSLSPNEVMLKFSEALEEENIDEAVIYLRTSIREDYKNAFYQAQKDGVLQEIADAFKNFEERYINDNTAEFIIKYEEEGKTFGSPVILMRNNQGYWEIHSF